MASHGIIKDTGAYFVIDPATRSVKVPKEHRVIGTEGEHLSEQIIFECPQIIDGHDISQCERRYVAWLNTEGTPGHDELRIDRVENDNVYLSWDIRQGLTIQKGVVQFSIHFEDTNGGSLAYRFVTTTCKSCEILESVNATLGAYKAMWVVDDTLVLEDFTPVEHGALDLETPGIVPDGTLEINGEGVHEVAEYAKVEVKGLYEQPFIAVNEADGTITATANGKETTGLLSKTVCATLLGLQPFDADITFKEGTLLDSVPSVLGVQVSYQTVQGDGLKSIAAEVFNGETLSFCQNTMAVIKPPAGYRLDPLIGGAAILSQPDANGSPMIISFPEAWASLHFYIRKIT